MATPFRFAAVLKVREAERDAKRRALAQEVAEESRLISEQNRLQSERLSVLRELNGIHSTQGHLPPVSWRIDQILARQQLMSDLSEQIAKVESALTDARLRLQRCHQEFVEASSAVKGLEKLAERHHIDQLNKERSKEDQDRNDWQRPKRVA